METESAIGVYEEKACGGMVSFVGLRDQIREEHFGQTGNFCRVGDYGVLTGRSSGVDCLFSVTLSNGIDIWLDVDHFRIVSDGR